MKKNIKNNLLEGSIFKSLLTLFIPIALANLLQMGYQITDAFWVGRLGAAAVAAVSVSYPVTFLVIGLGAGLAVAGSTLIAQYKGAGNSAMVNHVAAQTMLMVTITSVVLSLIGYALSPSILRLIGVEADVFNGALGFMRVSFVGMIFVFLYLMFQSLMRGIGETIISLYIVCATVVLNFLLDPLFIFGLWFIPPMGVMGAAIATLTTQLLAAGAGFFILWRGSHGIKLSLNSFVPDLPYIKRAFFLGLPSSVELSTRSMGLMVMTFLVSSFGTLTLAAYGVGANILQMVTMLTMSLSMALATLVGQNLGAGNRERANDIAVLGIKIGFSALTMLGALAFIFAPLLVSFFIPNDNAVIEEGANFVRIMALTWGVNSIQLCVVSTFRASGNMLAAMVLALVTQWVIQFPLAYVLSKHTTLQAHGLWWAFPVTNIIVATVALLWFAKGDWKKIRLTEEDYKNANLADEIVG